MSGTKLCHQTLEEKLRLPDEKPGPVALDSLAGCGGLALGFETAGGVSIGFEVDEDRCVTYRHNLRSPCYQIRLALG